jgi:hypothetical protein
LGSVCLHAGSRGFALDDIDTIYFHVSLYLKNSIQYPEYILPRYHGLIDKNKCGAYMKFRDIPDRKSINQNCFYLCDIFHISKHVYHRFGKRERNTGSVIRGKCEPK